MLRPQDLVAWHRIFSFASILMTSLVCAATLGVLLWDSAAFCDDAASPEYSKDIAPLLAKYCAGCHNADDRDGKLSLESFADLEKGGERGPAVIPGNGKGSRLIRVMTGAAEPKMPPEDSPVPSDD